MKEIKYIGFYSDDKNRNAFPSAVAKMQYIYNALNDIGIRVEIVSPCRLVRRTGQAEKTKKISINSMTSLHLCGSIPERNIIWKMMQIIYSWIWLFCYLVFHVGKEETVLVYHVIILDKIVMAAKKIKGFKVISEVGEIFADVERVAFSNREQEIANIRKADAYMYSTELLNSVCNPENKKYVVAQGTYKVQKELVPLFDDEKKHLVYAGILRIDKGVDVAIKMGKYLSDSYVIHILGYGEKRDIIRVKELIERESKLSQCEIRYEGLLSGDEYNQFIQSCDLGLCTQSSDVSYNTTAFPSKVISYLSNGIGVIAVRIESLEKSEVRHLIKLYDNSKSPEKEIADIVKKFDFEKYSKKYIRSEIEKLDRQFKTNLEILLDAMEGK